MEETLKLILDGINGISKEIKEINNKLNNIELDIVSLKNETRIIEDQVARNIEATENINVDKLTLLTLEETTARLKKENFLIKQHLGMK